MKGDEIKTMSKTMTINDFLNKAEFLIESVSSAHDSVVIQQDGKAVAAVVPIEAYRRLLKSDAPDFLNDLVASAQAGLAKALANYDNEEVRFEHLRTFRKHIKKLWYASEEREDEFRQVLILLRAGLEDFGELSYITPDHLRAFQRVAKVLEQPEITSKTRNEMFDHLWINGINTLPKIPNIVELMEKAGI